MIFSNVAIQDDEVLRSILLKHMKDCDFEAFYQEVLDGDFSHVQKEIVQIAIIDIFKRINEIWDVDINRFGLT
jgi:hypothetical protein